MKYKLNFDDFFKYFFIKISQNTPIFVRLFNLGILNNKLSIRRYYKSKD